MIFTGATLLGYLLFRENPKTKNSFLEIDKFIKGDYIIVEKNTNSKNNIFVVFDVDNSIFLVKQAKTLEKRNILDIITEKEAHEFLQNGTGQNEWVNILDVDLFNACIIFEFEKSQNLYDKLKENGTIYYLAECFFTPIFILIFCINHLFYNG